MLTVALCGVPAVGVILAGGPVTVKFTPLLASPPTVTTTFPVVAPVGTVTTMVVAFQVLAVPADVPLNVTVFAPCALPKFVPVIVTVVLTCPDVGFRLVMLGPVPPLPAARKATICITQGCTLSSAAVAL